MCLFHVVGYRCHAFSSYLKWGIYPIYPHFIDPKSNWVIIIWLVVSNMFLLSIIYGIILPID